MKKPRELEKRIMNKVFVDEKTRCWEWTGALFKKPHGDYGQLRMGGRKGGLRRAHVVSYEFFVGEIEKGNEIDHLCHNTICVNPEHLEAVSHTVNMGRRKDRGLPNCRYGHPYTPETTYINVRGSRECRVCIKERSLASYYRKKLDTS